MNKEDDAHSAGLRGEALPFNAGTIDEQIAHEKGRNSALGLGGANLLMILAFGPTILTILGCFWPLMGIVTYASFVLTKDFFIAHFPGQGILTMFATYGAAGLALYLTNKAEWWLIQFPTYVIVRHVARLIALMVFYVVFTLTFYGPRYIPDPITLDWIDKQLTIRDYFAMIAIVVTGHFVARRMEGRFLELTAATSLGRNVGLMYGRYAPSIGLDPTESRAERRARQKKAGLVFGAIGAVFLLLIGEPAGSILFGFLFFGLLGALAAPFMPRRYFGQRAKIEGKLR